MADELPDAFQKGNWIKVYRTLVESAIWPDADLVRLFIWCLFRANFEDRAFIGQVVRRGQFVTGRDAASEQLGVSPSKWYRDMKKLAELGYISIESNNKWTTVTVCNYGIYQDRDSATRTTDEQRMNNGWTTNEQRMNTREELKNLRREEEHSHSHGEPESKNLNAGASINGRSRDGNVVALQQLIDGHLMPPAWIVPDALAAINEWCDWFFTRNGRRMDVIQLREQLRECASWTPGRLVASIRVTIARGRDDRIFDAEQRAPSRSSNRPEPAPMKKMEPIR